MGRRSQHTPEELRELILVATRRVVENEGISQPSAREIARAIGYAPGTLYNMFDNLAEILLHVEARILSELEVKLSNAVHDTKPRDGLKYFVDTYVDFAFDNERAWSLVLKHQPDPNTTIPDWYVERAYAPLGVLETIVTGLLPALDATEVARRARAAWSVLHGLIQVGMTTKLGVTPRATLTKMAHDAVAGTVFGSPQSVPIGRSPRRTEDKSGRSASAAE